MHPLSSSPDDSLDSPALSRETSSEQIAGPSMSQSDRMKASYAAGDVSQESSSQPLVNGSFNYAGPHLGNRSSIATFTSFASTTTASSYTPPNYNSFTPDSTGSRTPSTPPMPHRIFWLYDGSIVLCVQHTLFRVHQTILANHSEIFADLFTVPQPRGQHTIEGCHVVHLYDNEKDFADLLNAVYTPDHFETLPTDADLDTVLAFIEGILRLSTKYMIRHFRQRCISLLLTKFPHTFERYDLKATSSLPPDRYRSDTIMRVIRIAQENNVPEALPYAFYCLSRFPHKRFLKDRPGDISWRDKMITLIGRERLHWAEMSISHSFLLVFKRSPVCRSALCAHARGPHAEWHEQEKHKAPHPLRPYKSWEKLNVCPDCVAYCQALHLQGRKDVWKHLPTWFELPEWEQLSEAQNR